MLKFNKTVYIVIIFFISCSGLKRNTLNLNTVKNEKANQIISSNKNILYNNIKRKASKFHKINITPYMKPYQLLLLCMCGLFYNIESKDCNNTSTNIIAFFKRCCPDGWTKVDRMTECMGFDSSRCGIQEIAELLELVLCERQSNPFDQVRDDLESLEAWNLTLTIILGVAIVVAFFCLIGLWTAK
ncbi:MAG: hypothetical protein GY830_07140 [Bacteroidetes bacterium]|nr:hypothetical protein [Bacteroidota bacterium]